MKGAGRATLLLLLLTANAQAQVADRNAEILHRAERALTAVIVHDIFSPPVASRIYLYANISAYEAVVPFQEKYKSLSGSLNGFPVLLLTVPEKKADKNLVCLYAFMTVAQRLVFSEALIQDSMKTLLRGYQKLPAAIYKSSVSLGQRVADSVLAWAAKDHYLDTRKLRRYNYSKAEGKWLPTPPGYMAAVEPYWNRIRTLTLDSASECKPPPPPVFSKDKNTEFYAQAYDVYKSVLDISPAQHDIAMFWDCNPFYLNTQGHLNFATKKLSPGGHWMSIAGIAARKRKADLVTSAAAYVVTAIALFDAFISCWDEKYRSNLIRPETYINSYIDETWRPVLQTPPFPEYISGHSVISTAAAIALTDFFGDHFSFDDNTETDYGLPVRSYLSFNDAAEEAAISRFYGGIHYRVAIVNGQQQGKLVGEKTRSRIHLLR